jgi:very-short-patch-repair endonuclease
MGPGLTSRQMTTAEFVERARAKHGGRFDYSGAEYRGFRQPITLTCLSHGVFQTAPKYHLHSAAGGCRKCIRRTVNVEKLRMPAHEFIRRASAVHKGQYDYSALVYVKNNVPVSVVCRQHGPFRIRPDKHLIGHGCRQCANERLSRKRRLSVWYLIERLMNREGPGNYDYNLRGYANMHSLIQIRCPKHGWFHQRVVSHLKGGGCAKCSCSRGEHRVREVLRSFGVKYEEQARFAGCRDRLKLPFDFHLPGHRVLIEYDGRQHFEKSELWGVNSFEHTQRHDAIKNRFAAEQGFRLIRIPYWDYDRIEEILRRELCGSPAATSVA